MIIVSPESISKRDFNKKSIFLAGSIDNGNAVDWQTDLSGMLNDMGYNVFNPRRENWDPNVKQDATDPVFNQQVNWELNALKHSDLIIFNFIEDSQSLITLLEFGLYAVSGKCIVICPDGFHRKGNVEVTCNFYNTPLYNSYNEFLRDSFKEYDNGRKYDILFNGKEFKKS